MRFTVGGDRADEQVIARADALSAAALVAGVGPPRLMWARRGRRCVATAMVLERVGHTGLLFRSPVTAPGVESEGLSAVVGEIGRSAIAGGLSMVQCFVLPDDDAEIHVLRRADFQLLAELAYLRLDLPVTLPPEADSSVAWTCRSYDQVPQRELEGLIAATYEGSLDCPDLRGVRAMSDVLDSHRASGEFRPQSWWVFEYNEVAAGCILVNGQASSRDVLEVVYVGVSPALRGRGLGRRMLRHAIREAIADGATVMKLAVDTRNVYAQRIYTQEGFQRVDCRQVWVLLKNRP